MKSLMQFCLACLMLLMLSACSLPLMPDTMDPELSAIKPTGSRKSERTVAYYIEATDRIKIVTPGGLEETSTFQPYRDVEPAFVKMLGTVFSRVVQLPGPVSKEELIERGISYVVVPHMDIQMERFAETRFPKVKITLSCAIRSTDDGTVTNKTALGSGNFAEHAVFNGTPLAGRYAAIEALMKMQSLLAEMPALH